MITVAPNGQEEPIRRGLADDERLDYLAGRSLGELLAAQARATCETLIRHNRPTRLMALPRLDEERLGALFMHFMLETMLTAHILGIDPFDQPAVEEGKILARRYLSDMERRVG